MDHRGGILWIFIDILSIVLVAWLSGHLKSQSHWEYYFVGESNRPLPLISGIMMFIIFKKMRLRYMPLINIMGGSTFGVLLIHANGNVRRWLWYDFLHNMEMYTSPWLVGHAIGSVLAIFIVCVAIDRMRIRFVESYLMTYFDKLWPVVVKSFNRIETWFGKKTGTLLGE